MGTKGILALADGGWTWLIPYKQVKLFVAPYPLPCCLHCSAVLHDVTVEEIQYGFEGDKHRLICVCDECQQASIFEYYAKIEV